MENCQSSLLVTTAVYHSRWVANFFLMREDTGVPNFLSMYKKILGLIAVVLVIGGAAKYWVGRSVSDEDGISVGESQEDVTVKTDEGTWSTSNKLPEDFPSDAPVYPDATVQGSLAAEPAGEASGGHYVGLQTSASSADVVAWYKREIAAKGWAIKGTISSGESVILSATKDTRALSVTIASDGGVTSVSLVVANQ